jgi:hypothetical protein
MNKTTTSKKSQQVTKMSKNKEFSGEPSENIINNILNYSKALSILKSKSIEQLEIVLN